jgi:hypothetical protein
VSIYRRSAYLYFSGLKGVGILFLAAIPPPGTRGDPRLWLVLIPKLGVSGGGRKGGSEDFGGCGGMRVALADAVAVDVGVVEGIVYDMVNGEKKEEMMVVLLKISRKGGGLSRSRSSSRLNFYSLSNQPLKPSTPTS